jgi:hypothetical protein
MRESGLFQACDFTLSGRIRNRQRLESDPASYKFFVPNIFFFSVIPTLFNLAVSGPFYISNPAPIPCETAVAVAGICTRLTLCGNPGSFKPVISPLVAGSAIASHYRFRSDFH